MPISLNLRFQATEECGGKDDPTYDYEHFRGEILLNKISEGLTNLSWKFAEIYYWRDCGWAAIYRREPSELEIILAPFFDKQFHKEWMLQVAPNKIPFIGRLFGRKPSATPLDVYQLACDVHTLLNRESTYRNPRWSWYEPPNENNSALEPLLPKCER